MPHSTIVKPEFGVLVKELMGDLSYMQVSYKTGISAEYLRLMVNGRVPSENMLQRFADGMGADIKTLRIAAGYDQPADLVTRVEIALRSSNEISDQAKEDVLSFVREMVERYPPKKKGGDAG